MGPKVIKYVVLAVIAVNLAIVAIVFLGGNTPPARPLPNPNGYDDFVKAGAMVTGNVSDNDTMSKEQLAELVATNSEALRLVRTGLSKECAEPVAYTTNYENSLLTNLASFKSAALLLRAEGRLAELEGHTNDAANIYLEEIRFGQESTRRGLVISRLVSIACEKTGLYPLGLLIHSLGAEQCREIAKALETIDAKEEPLQDTLQEEKLWWRRTFGFRTQIFANIFYRQGNDRAISRIQSTQMARRRMMINFAARAYELDKGKPPQIVVDLVPDYLKAVPKDPVTGQDMGLGR